MKSRTKRILFNISSAVLVTMIVLLSFCLLVSLIFNIVYLKTNVRGWSMQPTLNEDISSQDIDGDTVYINQFADVNIGDIVVANVDWWTKGNVIKTLVATPGDYFDIRDEGAKYGLYVNSECLYTIEKTYIGRNGGGGSVSHYGQYLEYLSNNADDVIIVDGRECVLMGDNEYFIIGDNWGESKDSLYNGPVSRERIIGRVDLVIGYDEPVLPNVLKYMFSLAFRV